MSFQVSGKQLGHSSASSCKHLNKQKKTNKRKTTFCLIIRIAKAIVEALPVPVEYWNLFENIMLDSMLWQEQQEGVPESLAPLFSKRKWYLVLQICRCRCFLCFLSNSEIKMEKKGSPLVPAALNCASLSQYGFRSFLRAPLLSLPSFWHGKVLSRAAWTLPSAARCRCQSDSLWELFIIP